MPGLSPHMSLVWDLIVERFDELVHTLEVAFALLVPV